MCMSLGILNLQGGNIGQHMTGDIVTASEKNMENWNAVGEVSVEYAGGVNTLEYENIVKPTLDEFIYDKMGYTYTGSGVTSSYFSLQDVLDVMAEHPTWRAYMVENVGGRYFNIVNATSYTETTAIYSEGIQFKYIVNADNEITRFQNKNTVSSGTINLANYDKAAYICTYNDTGSGGGTFNGYIDKNFNVENGKRYMIMFECYSPSGFKATDNNVIITSGTNTSNITIDNENITDYAQYYQFIDTDGTTLNVKFDLHTMSTTEGNVEVKIGSIEIYKLN